ncbi:MAG: phosphatase PAP2 family protein [Clostridia bacterium]|nr:phosphatase PAP2 family protein [Clostridia bacterium]
MDSIKQYFKNHPIIFMFIYTAVYFLLFSLLEATIVPRYIIHSPIDDIIPFCEYFIVPYLMWFIYVPAVLFYLVAKDRDSFWKMVKMMFVGNMLCLLLYALFPNGVMPKQPVAADNIFARMVNTLYHTDTPTNVCPSIHVLDTLSAHIALTRSRYLRASSPVKITSFVFFIMVCISTVTLKQHSIIDIFASLVLMVFLEKFAYSKKLIRI